jgi:hypothetical protein
MILCWFINWIICHHIAIIFITHMHINIIIIIAVCIYCLICSSSWCVFIVHRLFISNCLISLGYSILIILHIFTALTFKIKVLIFYFLLNIIMIFNLFSYYLWFNFTVIIELLYNKVFLFWFINRCSITKDRIIFNFPNIF